MQSMGMVLSGVKRKANGSRSGAEAPFDARSFRQRMRDDRAKQGCAGGEG